VTITSATKAFNIAGVRTAVANVAPAALRAAWDAQPPDLFGAPNVLGVEATLAAWRDGDGWLDDVRRHLHDRRDQVVRRLAGTSITLRPPEATYLAWLDCRACGIDGDPAAWFLDRGGVQLSPGPDFGPGNEQRARLNFATSSTVLDGILDRLTAAVPR
jgi:bifunctional pyridoxal-dependent enzyme with beta-cystathionase and maltose regulon repressor activities